MTRGKVMKGRGIHDCKPYCLQIMPYKSEGNCFLCDLRHPSLLFYRQVIMSKELNTWPNAGNTRRCSKHWNEGKNPLITLWVTATLGVQACGSSPSWRFFLRFFIYSGSVAWVNVRYLLFSMNVHTHLLYASYFVSLILKLQEPASYALDHFCRGGFQTFVTKHVY